MSESILTIIIVVIISLGVFGFIKLVCKPIKTVTAKSSSSSPNPTPFYDESSHTEDKKSKNKKNCKFIY